MINLKNNYLVSQNQGDDERKRDLKEKFFDILNKNCIPDFGELLTYIYDLYTSKEYEECRQELGEDAKEMASITCDIINEILVESKEENPVVKTFVDNITSIKDKGLLDLWRDSEFNLYKIINNVDILENIFVKDKGVAEDFGNDIRDFENFVYRITNIGIIPAEIKAFFGKYNQGKGIFLPLNAYDIYLTVLLKAYLKVKELNLEKIRKEFENILKEEVINGYRQKIEETYKNINIDKITKVLGTDLPETLIYLINSAIVIFYYHLAELVSIGILFFLNTENLNAKSWVNFVGKFNKLTKNFVIGRENAFKDFVENSKKFIKDLGETLINLLKKIKVEKAKIDISKYQKEGLLGNLVGSAIPIEEINKMIDDIKNIIDTQDKFGKEFKYYNIPKLLETTNKVLDSLSGIKSSYEDLIKEEREYGVEGDCIERKRKKIMSFLERNEDLRDLFTGKELISVIEGEEKGVNLLDILISYKFNPDIDYNKLLYYSSHPYGFLMHLLSGLFTVANYINKVINGGILNKKIKEGLNRDDALGELFTGLNIYNSIKEKLEKENEEFAVEDLKKYIVDFIKRMEKASHYIDISMLIRDTENSVKEFNCISSIKEYIGYFCLKGANITLQSPDEENYFRGIFHSILLYETNETVRETFRKLFGFNLEDLFNKDINRIEIKPELKENELNDFLKELNKIKEDFVKIEK